MKGLETGVGWFSIVQVSTALKALTRYEGFGNTAPTTTRRARAGLKALTRYEGFGNLGGLWIT